MSSARANRSPLEDVSVNAAARKTREELLAEWKERRKREKTQHPRETNVRRAPAASAQGAKTAAGARPVRAKAAAAAGPQDQDKDQDLGMAHQPSPAKDHRATRRAHAIATEAASAHHGHATRQHNDTATTPPASVSMGTHTSSHITDKRTDTAGHHSGDQSTGSAGNARPERQTPHTADESAAVDIGAAQSMNKEHGGATAGIGPADSSTQRGDEGGTAAPCAAEGSKHTELAEARAQVASLLSLPIEPPVTCMAALRVRAADAVEAPDSPQLYSSKMSTRQQTHASKTASPARTRTAAGPSTLPPVSTRTGLRSTPAPLVHRVKDSGVAASASVGTPYLSRAKCASSTSTSTSTSTPKPAPAVPRTDTMCADGSDEENEPPALAPVVHGQASTPVPRLRHARVSDAFDPQVPADQDVARTPVLKRSGKTTELHGSREGIADMYMDEDIRDEGVASDADAAAQLDMQTILDGSPRPPKRPKRRSMAMHELLDTGLHSPSPQKPAKSAPAATSSPSTSPSRAEKKTTTSTSRSSRRMVSVGVQTAECDWLMVLSQLADNAAAFECPGDCPPPCLCCMVRRVTGGAQSPLAFALCKAKANADESTALRFLNGILEQELKEVKKSKAEDTKTWKALLEETEKSQQRLLECLRKETDKCKQLEEMVKELSIDKEELDGELASLRLQLAFDREGINSADD